MPALASDDTLLTIIPDPTVSEADWVIVKAGIGGTKYALDKFVAPGLGGVPRKPLPIADDATRSLIDRGMKAASKFLHLIVPSCHLRRTVG